MDVEDKVQKSLPLAGMRTGLYTLVGLLLAGMAALVLDDIRITRRFAVQDAERMAKNLVRTLDVHATAAFRDADRVLHGALALPELPPLAGAPRDTLSRRLENLLAGFTLHHPEYRGLALLSDSGSVTARTGDVPEEALSAELAAAATAVVAHGDGVSLRPGPGGLALLAHADAAGKNATAVLTLNLNTFGSFYAALDVGTQGTVKLATRQGQVLAHHPAAATGLSPAEIRALAESGARADGVVENGDGGMVAFSRLPDLPLVVTVTLADRDYLGHWEKTRSQRVMGLLGVVVLVGALAGILSRQLRRLERVSQDLRQSEQRMRRMVEGLPAGAVYVENGHLVLNREAERLTGFAREDLPTLNDWFDKVHPDDPGAVRAMYFAALAGGFPNPVQLQLQTGDGLKRTVAFIAYGSAEEAVWLLHDITDRINAEKGLKATTSRLTALVRALPDAVLILDETGRYLEVLRSDSGTDGSALAGRSLNEVVPPAVASLLRDAIHRTILSGDGETVEYALTEGDRERWFEGRTATLPPDFAPTRAVLLAARDITARRRAESALRESEARYALAIQGTRDGIWDWQMDEDAFYLSPAWYRMLEQPAPALPLTCAAWLTQILPEDRLVLRNVLLQAQEGTLSTVETTFRATSGGGQRLWLTLKGRVSLDEGGHPSRITGTVSDVTEKRLAEEKLRLAKEIAEAANEAKSQFLATMSHELRTPLNAIIGFSEMLSRGEEARLSQARHAEYARYIHTSGLHLLALINDILDMSKLEAGLYQVVEEIIDLHQVAEASLSMVRLRAENNGLSLENLLPETLPAVQGDRRALQQVLINLLSNAVKFTNAGGRVTLEGLWEPGAPVSLVITDTGIGIPADALERVLEPFQQADMTTSRHYGGTGLGLPISRNLVALHGGTLVLESTLGVGTRVTVTLPPERVHSQIMSCTVPSRSYAIT